MNGGANIDELRLCEADADLAADVQAFHRRVTDPNDPNLVDRSEIELRSAADNGLLFTVFHGPTIVASAGFLTSLTGMLNSGERASTGRSVAMGCSVCSLSRE